MPCDSTILVHMGKHTKRGKERLPGSSWKSVRGLVSGSALNILPTGPSMGVKESLLPHTTSSGPLTDGISWSGGVPGGPA